MKYLCSGEYLRNHTAPSSNKLVCDRFMENLTIVNTDNFQVYLQFT